MYLIRISVVSWLLSGTGHCSPMVLYPAPSADVRVTSLNTLNSSVTGLAPLPGEGRNPAGERVLSVNIANDLDSVDLMVYVSGLDPYGRLVMLDRDGTYHYPAANSPSPIPLDSNVAIPLGAANTTLALSLPGFIESARVWVADGGLEFFVVATPTGPGLVEPSVLNPEDPNSATDFAFVEFDWGAESGLYADITFVDFVGLPLGVAITDSAGITVTTPGMPVDGAALLCDSLKAHSREDGLPWDQLCVYTDRGDLIRVLSPNSYVSANRSAFADYFSKYVGYCWAKYSALPLTIDTQSSDGLTNCTVGADDMLTCDGDNRPYPRPSAEDIFGCGTGPFFIEDADNAIHRAVVPRLCAAFNRATLYMPSGNIQPAVPPSRYFEHHPANWYAALVHEIEVDGRGYAFAYDDVTPDGSAGTSGLIVSSDPVSMTISVGGK